MSNKFFFYNENIIITDKKPRIIVGSHVNSPFGTSAHDLLYPFATPSFLAS
jgi:hypothetical protein